MYQVGQLVVSSRLLVTCAGTTQLGSTQRPATQTSLVHCDPSVQAGAPLEPLLPLAPLLPLLPLAPLLPLPLAPLAPLPLAPLAPLAPLLPLPLAPLAPLLEPWEVQIPFAQVPPTPQFPLALQAAQTPLWQKPERQASSPVQPAPLLPRAVQAPAAQ
jgi:hypothetical protein